jgi:hypothetical protein
MIERFAVYKVSPWMYPLSSCARGKILISSGVTPKNRHALA